MPDHRALDWAPAVSDETGHLQHDRCALLPRDLADDPDVQGPIEVGGGRSRRREGARSMWLDDPGVGAEIRIGPFDEITGRAGETQDGRRVGEALPPDRSPAIDVAAGDERAHLAANQREATAALGAVG